MNKDVIYIDVDDDITAIIGKIKASDEKIIALVPPKRVGILQSAVNLRLLDRMANTSHKKLVLITNNQALVALSAAAGIPVAKNLQSKPEIAEISALHIDDEDDIIDGSQLPVGELEKTADIIPVVDKSIDEDLGTIDIDEKSIAMAGAATKKAVPKHAKSGIKVPNFNTFRKKLFIGIAAGALLVVFLVWATVFAPSAKVIITARTTQAPVSTTVTLAGNAATDVSKGLIQSKVQQSKKDISVDFDATGQKNIGSKATGTANLSQQSLAAASVPAGTQLTTSNGLVFVTDAAATVPASTFGPGCFPTACAGTTTVAVTASSGGTDYNGATGSLTGAPGSVSASLAAATSGGTDKVAKVVSANDIALATDKLKEQSTTEAKKALVKLFVNGEVTIDESFTVEYGAPVSAPAVDTEAATGKAKLTSNVTYTITAIAKADLEVFLNADLEKQLVGKANQKVYDTGISKVKLTGYSKTATASTVKIVSTGQIGPKIDEEEVKQQVKGKIFGEVQDTLGSINGVSDVEVQFSFFWVRTVPNDVNRISVEFKLQDN